MTRDEFEDCLVLIDIELSEYQEELKQGTKQEIYDSTYQTNFYEEFRQYFVRYGRMLDKKMFPKNNILAHFYQKYCEMPYNDTTLSIKMCVDKEIERNSINNDSEM